MLSTLSKFLRPPFPDFQQLKKNVSAGNVPVCVCFCAVVRVLFYSLLKFVRVCLLQSLLFIAFIQQIYFLVSKPNNLCFQSFFQGAVHSGSHREGTFNVPLKHFEWLTEIPQLLLSSFFPILSFTSLSNSPGF